MQAMPPPPPSSAPISSAPGRAAVRAGLRRARPDYRRAVLLGLGAALGLALMMNGAVATPYREVAVLVLALPLLLTLGVRITHAPTRRAVGLAMGCAGALGLWGVVQAAPLPDGLPDALHAALAHPVWTELAQTGVAVGAHVSVAPVQTLAALPALIAPFLVFAAMLVLCQGKSDALFAWKMLAAIGLGLAVLSLMLELFFAGQHFFATAPVGQGAFSGIFVNRNVTAAFLVLVATATAAWLFLPDPQRLRRERVVARDGVDLIGPSRAVLAALLFLLVILLILTRSRAGGGVGLAALTLGIMAVVVRAPGRRGAGRWRALLKSGLAALIGVGVVVAFGEPMLSRMATTGEDGRWCVYAATWAAIQDRPLTGAGFGTFAEVFPRYRDPACLGTRAIWLQAHNSWLEFGAGMGLVGAVVLGAGLLGLTGMLIHGIRARRSLRAIPVFALMALVFVALHSMVDFPLQIPGLALYFAALMGAGCATALLQRRSSRRTTRRTTRRASRRT